MARNYTEFMCLYIEMNQDVNETTPVVRAVVGQLPTGFVAGLLGGLGAILVSYVGKALDTYTGHRLSFRRSSRERRERWYREMHGHAWRAFAAAHNQPIYEDDGTFSDRLNEAVADLVLVASKAPSGGDEDVIESARTVRNAHEDAIRGENTDYTSDLEEHLYALLEEIRDAADDLAYEPTESFDE